MDIGQTLDMSRPPARSKEYVQGTHEGNISDPIRRAVRAAKNARNKARVHPEGVHHLAMPVAGNQKAALRRLTLRGNRMARGGSRR